MNNKNNEELQFVAKHYKPNCLNTNQAWQRFKERRGIKGWGGKRKIAVAASITLAIGFAVAAGIIGYHNYMLPQKPIQNKILADSAIAITSYEHEECDTTEVFRFDNTPINQVLNELSRHYNTKLTTNDTTKSVSGEIEAANVEDAIEVLETTLGVRIERK